MCQGCPAKNSSQGRQVAFDLFCAPWPKITAAFPENSPRFTLPYGLGGAKTLQYSCMAAVATCLMFATQSKNGGEADAALCKTLGCGQPGPNAGKPSAPERRQVQAEQAQGAVFFCYHPQLKLCGMNLLYARKALPAGQDGKGVCAWNGCSAFPSAGSWPCCGASFRCQAARGTLWPESCA